MISNMLTDRDMQKLRKEFATKKEFYKRLNKLSDEIIEVINAISEKV